MPLFTGLQKRVTGLRLGAAVTALWVVVCVGVATLLRLALDPLLGPTLWFPTYYPAALVGTLLLGWRPGLIILLLSACAANYFFVPPKYAFALDSRDIAGTVVFLIADGLIVLAASLLRASLQRLEAAHAREAVLNAELQHRMKNTLAIVQGLVAQTARRGVHEPQDFLAVLEGRLLALASAHDLLSRGRWDICELPDLADRALAPFSAQGRVSISGPACTLRAEACVPLVLGLHELATNAMKYGALSVDRGTVELTWRTATDAEDAILLHWAERGGPAVSEPGRRGFGRRLLARQPGLEAVALQFKPQGVECEITVLRGKPLEQQGLDGLAAAKVQAALSALLRRPRFEIDALTPVEPSHDHPDRKRTTPAEPRRLGA